MNTPAPTPDQRKALALQRLDASRTRLIQQLYPAPPGGPARSTDTAGHPGLERLLTVLLDRVQRDGWARGAWRATRALGRQWWKRQPWHAPAALVVDTLAREVRPLVRRHPWACLATAVALGAGVVLARPWLSRTVRQQAHSLPAQTGNWLRQQLTQAPVQLALAGALSAWLSDRARRPPARTSGAASAAATTAPPAA